MVFRYSIWNLRLANIIGKALLRVGVGLFLCLKVSERNENLISLIREKCNENFVVLYAGIGYAVVLIAFYVDFFYNVIIAWCLRFFFASFTSNLPWTSCGNYWNTMDCKPVI